MLMCRFAATSGRIPIMTNSAIPNPKVPNAKASKLFFITTVFRYRRSPTERSLSCCDRKRFVRATATVPRSVDPVSGLRIGKPANIENLTLKSNKRAGFLCMQKTVCDESRSIFARNRPDVLDFSADMFILVLILRESIPLIVMQAIRLLAVLGIVLLKFSDYGSHSTQQRTDNFG